MTKAQRDIRRKKAAQGLCRRLWTSEHAEKIRTVRGDQDGCEQLGDRGKVFRTTL